MTALRTQALKPMYRNIALTLTAATFAHTALCGQFDWPQWQGPDRTAHSKETGLLKEWPKDGPPLAWKIQGLGGGDSMPSVAAGRIYGMSHRGADEIVWALSEKDGKEIWAVRIAPAHSQSWPQSKEGPSCTPTVDGDRLYVMGLAGNVVLRTRSVMVLSGTSMRTGEHSTRTMRVFGGSAATNAETSALFPMPSSPTTARWTTCPPPPAALTAW